MDLTLVIMAAGIGSRYGGVKQLDGIGPSGETIMDYSIYDAIDAGYTKVVIIIIKNVLRERSILNLFTRMSLKNMKTTMQ